jgi:arsenate reductase
VNEIVLFACVHNAGRSQLASSWFNYFADPTKARAISAGTKPATSVHPEVARVLAEEGVEVHLESPRLLTDALVRRASLVVTMGCGESCPVIVGQEREDWPVPDPKGLPHAEVKAISATIRAKILDLLERRGWRTPPPPRDE